MRTCKLIAFSPARVYIALPKRLSQKKRWFGASTPSKPSWDTKIECPALIDTNDHAFYFSNCQNSLQKVTESSPSTKLVLSAPGTPRGGTAEAYFSGRATHISRSEGSNDPTKLLQDWIFTREYASFQSFWDNHTWEFSPAILIRQIEVNYQGCHVRSRARRAVARPLHLRGREAGRADRRSTQLRTT